METNKLLKSFTLIFFLPMFCFGQWLQIGNDIGPGNPDVFFGYSIELSKDGSTIAVGSPSNSQPGTVRVLRRTNPNWSQLGSDFSGGPGDFTGGAVSLSADGSVVAFSESNFDAIGQLAGRIKVFRYTANNAWIQIGNSIIGDSAFWGSYSISLSDDGSRLAIGHNRASVRNYREAGIVRIYENQSGNWVKIGNDILGLSTGEDLGRKVKLSSDGSIIAIGAVTYTAVFQYTGGRWNQIGNNINGTNSVSALSLSADGSILAVTGSGALTVYENANGFWNQIGGSLWQDSIEVAASVSLSAGGNILSVGAWEQDSIGFGSGFTLFFENQAGNWVKMGRTIDFGVRCSLSGSGAVVAIGSGPEPGYVKVFQNFSVLDVTDVERTASFVFPNPSADFFMLKSETEVLSYELFSMDGKLIRQETINGQKEFLINMNGFSRGNYLLNLKKNDSSLVIKLVKE
jgi:hypothetical protein